MSRTILPALLCIAFAASIAMLTSAPPAAAHEHVIVGEYELIVGWRVEPAYTGLLNGVDLGIQDHLPNGTTVWVTGAEASLTATLAFGSDSTVKDFDPKFGEPGWYTFDVIPTRAGAYTVRISGTLNTTAVNPAVTLDDVTLSGDIEFPTPDPTPTSLQDAINALRKENADLRTSLGAAVALGVVGSVLGVAGTAMAVTARRAARKP